MPDTSDPVPLLYEEFASLGALIGELEDEDWDKPTELPDWTVKDNLSHLCGVESWLLGRERPEPIYAGHVRNELGARNEGDVQMRRDWPPEKVVEDFRQSVRERTETLAKLTEKDLDDPSWTPAGMGTVRDMLAIRVLDLWYHEQDMRRATGRRGHLSGPVPTMIAKRMLSTLGATVGKRAAAPEGSVVVFDIPNLLPKPMTLEVVEGRAQIVDAPSHEPDVTLKMSAEAFLRFCGGRWEVAAALSAGLVDIHGDHDLGTRILEKMAVTP